MGLFVYTQKGSIISTVDLPTTEIIEPKTFIQQQSIMISKKEGQFGSILRGDIW